MSKYCTYVSLRSQINSFALSTIQSTPFQGLLPYSLSLSPSKTTCTFGNMANSSYYIYLYISEIKYSFRYKTAHSFIRMKFANSLTKKHANRKYQILQIVFKGASCSQPQTYDLFHARVLQKLEW